jgi:DNA-directed RNA polymerase subunit omega
MRDDFLKNALQVVGDPNILVNLVSLRVKQFKRGSRPLVESLEKLSPEDLALREVAEGKISYELGSDEIRPNVDPRKGPRLMESKPFVRPDSGLRSSSRDFVL